uniref:Lipoprotein n=1 Tax=Steinernema glaseri TaxID=37863 RepID=A0A1I7Y4J7_9BILA
MPASFTLPAEPGDEVSTVAAMPEQWPGTTMDVNEQVQAEYYPGMTDVYAAKGDDPQRVVLEFAETGEADAFSLWKVSARYRFKQASLQQQVDKGELALLPADEQNRKSLSIA